MKIKILLLYLYLKTIGRIFVYVLAQKHPNNEHILFARFMGKIAKKKMIDNG